MHRIHWKKDMAIGLFAMLALVVGVWLFWPKEAERLPGVTYEAIHVDPGPMLHLAEVLSSDALEGRGATMPGNDAARGFIRKRFEDAGVEPFLPGGWEQSFTILPKKPEETAGTGVNLVGWVPGDTPRQGPVILVTAHFDHLGIRDGEIYNGADDNASGAAMLTALAEYFVKRRPKHDILFVALDAEEIGLLGARALAFDPEVPMDRVALNINLDMVGRSEVGELYAAGTYHTPALSELVTEIAKSSPVTLLQGHDRPEEGPNDWTLQSDHGVFHQAGIPFLYFGVEDHPGYHHPSDDFEALTLDFYVRAADTLVSIINAADASLPEIFAARRAPAPPPSQTEGTPE
ncbi:M28 family peptidase [Hyphomonas sp.]|uniref:M28 family peptidase n=1 Tax=Hyphomonas sp. TaxID=87 RepID=UPI0025C6BF1E|nr:M28 family peptidase [Hyphomonas sp.]